MLGSEELYREWGYTAMSRHREQARFYLARTDLHSDPELPPPADPLIDSISRLLKRSQAKTLALDALPHAEREHLERERRQLHDELAPEPPLDREAREEQRDLDVNTSALDSARRRETLLQQQRDQVPWHDRKARRQLDKHLATNHAEQHALQTGLGNALDAVLDADRADHEWLTDHAPEAERLLAVDQELRARDHADTHAAHALDALAHHRPLEHLPLSLDLGPDTGLDMGM